MDSPKRPLITTDNPYVPALLAAILSAGLFLLIYGLGMGFLFLFIPTLPIFAAGLSHDARTSLVAALFSGFIIGLAAGPASVLLYLFFLGFPACFLVRQALLAKPGEGGGREWFPLGYALLQLTLYACIVIALIIAFYAGEEGGLPKIMASNLHEVFADAPAEYADAVDALSTRWAFLIFAVTLWLWGIALYVHGWVANRALLKRHKTLRPSFEITPFTIPTWMLTLLAISALASLIGSESMRFAGQAILISLLLPYFFLGASLMHRGSANWPARGFLLFLIYFIAFTQFLPALFIAGMGLIEQLKGLNKRLPEPKP